MGDNKNQPIRFQYSKIWTENEKTSKKVNISRDLILILAEYIKGRNTQNFQIVTDRRRTGTNLIDCFI